MRDDQPNSRATGSVRGQLRERAYAVDDEAGTVALARGLAERFGRGTVFALHGELGSGKTRFAQGLALALGVDEPVCSPTFTIMNEHVGRDGARFVHMDLYRLRDEADVEDLGFEEFVERAAVTAIEWPERAGELLPARTVHVWLESGDTAEARRIRIAWRDDG